MASNTLACGLQAGSCLLAVMATGTCCPVNAQNTVDEIVAELQAFRATSVIVAAHHENRVALENALARAKIRVVLLHPNPKTAGLFTLQACLQHKTGCPLV